MKGKQSKYRTMNESENIDKPQGNEVLSIAGNGSAKFSSLTTDFEILILTKHRLLNLACVINCKIMCKKIPTVRIEFKHLPDFILAEEDYKAMGKWKGFLREISINPKDVKKVHHILMKPEDYPTTAWEG